MNRLLHISQQVIILKLRTYFSTKTSDEVQVNFQASTELTGRMLMQNQVWYYYISSNVLLATSPTNISIHAFAVFLSSFFCHIRFAQGSINIPSTNNMSCVTANSLHYLQSLLSRVKQETIKYSDLLSCNTQGTPVLLKEE